MRLEDVSKTRGSSERRVVCGHVILGRNPRICVKLCGFCGASVRWSLKIIRPSRRKIWGK